MLNYTIYKINEYAYLYNKCINIKKKTSDLNDDKIRNLCDKELKEKFKDLLLIDKSFKLYTKDATLCRKHLK